MSIISVVTYFLLAVLAIVSAQNFGARDPFSYQNNVAYNGYPLGDPYGNGGTWSSNLARPNRPPRLRPINRTLQSFDHNTVFFNTQIALLIVTVVQI
uniref:Secreted protein n=1 Tax=Panagrellus redivivus TaxID=6233 RepID=A0A7E4UUT2_PANRE